MRCEVCQSKGLKHQVYFTLAERLKPHSNLPEYFFDEQDVRHTHCMYPYKTKFSCSNDHRGELIYIDRCPVVGCEWNQKAERYEQLVNKDTYEALAKEANKND